MEIVKVLLPVPINNSFIYFTSETTHLGEWVLVPFKKKTLIGIVVDLNCLALDESIQIKCIISKINLPLIKPSLINFINWVSSYNLIALGSLCKMVLSNVINVKFIYTNKLDNVFIKKNQEPKECNYIKLSDDQAIASKKITNNLDKYSVTVLDGETGSGKTEVYLSVISRLMELDVNAQILILLPEIILTSQLIWRVKKYFTNYRVVEWHSNLGMKSRRENWLYVAYGDCSIIIGTRSALFLPYKNLKMIIVDEEHESSFKQEQGGIYNARDMAIVLGREENIPVLLCSATPSLETIHNINNRKYSCIKLSKRFGEAELPSIKVVDMCKSNLNRTWLSSELHNKIIETLQLKYQVMLFLNRRGYAQLLLCKLCGMKINCPNCSVWLVIHKKRNILLCHYCGYNYNIPSSCYNCKEESLISYGIGVERIAQEIQQIVPQAKIGILTSDLGAKASALMINSILNQEIDVIIGTQVIAKGHNFPKLTLIGVVDSDLGLGNCDLRAAEKTYQLLHQISGRAGRFLDKGQVILQTYNVNSPIISALQSYQRDLFYELELKLRFLAGMPPYVKLIAIIISGRDENQVINIAKTMVRDLTSEDTRLTKIFQSQQLDLVILGPAPAPLSFLSKSYRYRILIKVKTNFLIQKLLKSYVDSLYLPRTVKVIIDVDPINFM